MIKIVERKQKQFKAGFGSKIFFALSVVFCFLSSFFAQSQIYSQGAIIFDKDSAMVFISSGCGAEKILNSDYDSSNIIASKKIILDRKNFNKKGISINIKKLEKKKNLEGEKQENLLIGFKKNGLPKDISKKWNDSSASSVNFSINKDIKSISEGYSIVVCFYDYKQNLNTNSLYNPKISKKKFSIRPPPSCGIII